MSLRVDPALLQELKRYGATEVGGCFQCGNCTAVCPFTDDQHTFPRDVLRRVQLGLRRGLRSSLDPWLCYYCGDCSKTCPRGAEPAETMMAVRRWLIAQFDATGLAARFYTSIAWELGAMAAVAMLVILLFALFHGPPVTDHVSLNSFAPARVIHAADAVMAAGLLFFVAGNVLRMHRSVMAEVHAPLSAYLAEAWNLVYHAVTQKRLAQCAEDEGDPRERRAKRLNWISHLLLVTGYVTMLVLVVFFLPWFQTDVVHPLTHPQRWLGYYATAVLLFGSGHALWTRLRGHGQLHRFSHPSDWIFPILLLMVTLTGILQHVFRLAGLPMATYLTYVVHLALAAPMLILEVPFGKWSHLYYRPLAIYFDSVQQRALAHQRSSDGVTAPAV
jgi:ferredoxin/nitrate reductase gamma subunit